MTAKITFFPVGNGDMTLVTLADHNKTQLLIDMNIRQAADNPKEDARDVAKDLRERLKKDSKGRPYVDVLLLSHPDKDHCTGLQMHFHLGPYSDYTDDNKPESERKIMIHELWSSPIVYRRASKNHTLCEDAKAFCKEAKRRVAKNKDLSFQGVTEGDRILIMGEDIDGKTDGLGPILIKADETFSKVNGQQNAHIKCLLLGPRPISDEACEDLLSKNHSSVILNIQIAENDYNRDGCRFLTGGDAEVAIWEIIWAKYKTIPEALEYDILQTPHHCSWHTLSHDSWSEMQEKATVSTDARAALSQCRKNAFIVASSKPVVDDENDPPCIGAKQEYSAIVRDVYGAFYCTGEYPTSKSPEPLEFEVTQGLSLVQKMSSAASIFTPPTPYKAG